MTAKRLNVTLAADTAAKLSNLADRARVPDGTLARSLLSAAIEDADPDARTITEILEGIPGFYERLEIAEQQVRKGEVIPLDEL